MQYSMRLAKRIDKNGCCPFDQKSVDNVPNIDIFIDSRINKIITDGCKEVLRRSMDASNPYRYGEQGLLVSTLDKDMYNNVLPHIHENFNGSYHRTVVNNKYKQAVNSRSINDLIFIHNHPNNSTFSAADLISFAGAKTIKIMVAIGNIHNIFIAEKIRSDEGAIEEYIEKYLYYYKKTYSKSKLTDKQIKDKAALEILKEPEKYGFYLDKLFRRNIK